MEPLVSVIVPTRNSQKYLQRCLESLSRQTFSGLEIVVVDNFSSDMTVEIAKEFTDHVFESGPERSGQINYGVKQARGLFIYRVDSDFYVPPSVVDECLVMCVDMLDAIVVHNTPDVSSGWIARARKFEIDMYKGNYLHTAARFLRRELFDVVGGYAVDITAGEDYDFQNRLAKAGARFHTIESDVVHLGEPVNIADMCQKYWYYGKDLRKFTQLYPLRHSSQLNAIRPELYRNWVEFVIHPLLGLSSLYLYVLKYVVGACGYIYQLIKDQL